MLDKMELVSRVSTHVSDLVDGLNKDIELVKKEKAQVESEKAKFLEEKKELVLKQNNLSNLVHKHEETLASLNKEKIKEQDLIDENDAAYKEIQNQITKYYEEQKRKLLENKQQNKFVPGENGYAWPVPGFTRLSSVFMEKRCNFYRKIILFKFIIYTNKFYNI